MPSEQTLDPNTPTVTVNPGQYDLPHTVKAPPDHHITGLPEFTITNPRLRTVFTRIGTSTEWEVGEEDPTVQVPKDDPPTL